MKATRHALIRSATASPLVLGPAGLVRAKDEDNIAQVYLEFDPETGELTSAVDAEAQATNHAQAQELQALQDGQESGPVTEIGSSAILASIIVAVALLSVVLIWKRRRPKNVS